MSKKEYPPRKTIIMGGKRLDAEMYHSRINHRATQLTNADMPKARRELFPGEERQFKLKFME